MSNYIYCLMIFFYVEEKDNIKREKKLLIKGSFS